jgi:hypothetical protein
MRFFADQGEPTGVLSKAEFARLVAEDPTASDEDILRRATSRSSIPLVGGDSSSFKRPSMGQLMFEEPILPELDIENPLARGAYGVVRNVVVGSPLDLALNVATAGSAGLARGAAKGISKVVAGGLSGAFGARGLSHAFDEEADPATRAGGALQGVLGAAGLANELRAFSPRLERLVSNQEGQIKIPSGWTFKPGPPKPLANPRSRELAQLAGRGELDPRILTKPDVAPEVLARAELSSLDLPTDRAVIPEIPEAARPVHQALQTGGRLNRDKTRSSRNLMTQDIARDIRKLDAEQFSHLSVNAAAKAIIEKLKADSGGAFAPNVATVTAIIRGDSWVEPGMVVRRSASAPASVGAFAAPLVTSSAAQFIDDEQDPDGTIRLGLHVLGLGSLGAAAYWQLKPATKLSTLAAGQIATGKSFDDFKALAPTYVPEGFSEKQLERAWSFAVQKVDALFLQSPRAFDEDYWGALYDADPSFQNWWDDALDVANEVAPENPELFALFLSATSAQAPPKANLQRALQAWDAYKKGEPFPRSLGRSINLNLNRSISEGRIGGRKTSSMADTVLRREQDGPLLPRAVLDRHMAKLSGFASNRKQDTVLNEHEYEVLERILTNVAEKKGIRLSQLQAGLWKHGMDLSGEQHLASLGREWQKPDISYSFGQIKKLLDAEKKYSGIRGVKLFKNFAQAAKHVVNQTVATPAKGATVDPRTGKSLAGQRGFAVSMFPERTLKVPVPHFSDSVVLSYMKDNLDLLDNPNLMVGSWNDGEGQIWLDVVAVVKDKHHAEWLGSPQRYNQRGAADLGLARDSEPFPDEAFIATGGTGEGFGPNAPKFYDRLGDLETIDIEHYSRTPGISELDPTFYGKGQAGEERKRASLPNWINRIYAYAAGTRPEARFRGLPKYTGRVPKRAVYDLNADELKLREQLDLSRPEGLNELEKLVADRGFLGMEFPLYKGYLQFFKKLGVEPEAVADALDSRLLIKRTDWAKMSHWERDQARFFQRLNTRLKKAFERRDVAEMSEVHDRLMHHLQATGQGDRDPGEIIHLVRSIRAAVSHIAPDSPQARYMRALSPLGAQRVAGGNIGSSKG